jgi:hypothetical protein
MKSDASHTDDVLPQCLWCERHLRTGRRRGSPKRFCSPAHRNAFWSAARRWTMQAIEAGHLSPEALKATQRGVHAFYGAGNLSGAAGSPGADPGHQTALEPSLGSQ